MEKKRGSRSERRRNNDDEEVKNVGRGERGDIYIYSGGEGEGRKQMSRMGYS